MQRVQTTTSIHLGDNYILTLICNYSLKKICLRFSDEDDDDDEDDELELQRELEQIKRDREAAAAKKALEEREESEKEASAAAMKGNPLLNTADSTARV